MVDVAKHAELVLVVFAVTLSAAAILVAAVGQSRVRRQIRTLRRQLAQHINQNTILPADVRRLEVGASRLKAELRSATEVRARIESECDYLRVTVRRWEAGAAQLRPPQKPEEESRVQEEGATEGSGRGAKPGEDTAIGDGVKTMRPDPASEVPSETSRPLSPNVVPPEELCSEGHTTIRGSDDRQSVSGVALVESVLAPTRDAAEMVRGPSSDGQSGGGPSQLNAGRPDGGPQAAYGCGRCGYSSQEQDDVLQHVEESHLRDLIRPMSYSEVAALDASLPPGIYRCGYCNFYIESTDLANPTSTVIRHIVSDCAHALRVGVPVRVSFRTITDVEEVKANVRPELQQVDLCQLCRKKLYSTGRSSGVEHLVASHLRDLVVRR